MSRVKCAGIPAALPSRRPPFGPDRGTARTTRCPGGTPSRCRRNQRRDRQSTIRHNVDRRAPSQQNCPETGRNLPPSTRVRPLRNRRGESGSSGAIESVTGIGLHGIHQVRSARCPDRVRPSDVRLLGYGVMHGYRPVRSSQSVGEPSTVGGCPPRPVAHWAVASHCQ